jgi:hypothetical protein
MPNITKTLYMREYRKIKRKKLRDYNREYNKAWRKKFGYHNEKNSQLRYPEKVKARKVLNRAIANGTIKRGTCCVCSEMNAQAHHDDYSKPLEVKWFCALHHKQHHMSRC